MASEDGRSERAGSIASSNTEAGGHEEFNEKSAFIRDDESMSTLKSPTIYQDSNHEADLEQAEDQGLLPEQEKQPEPPKASARSGLIWIVVNTLATVGIVSHELRTRERKRERMREIMGHMMPSFESVTVLTTSFLPLRSSPTKPSSPTPRSSSPSSPSPPSTSASPG